MNKIRSVRAAWASGLLFTGIGLFLIALAGSAFFIPEIRMLHVLQALIYVAVAVLVVRGNPWGFGAGVFVAVCWNCLSLFITHLFQAGLGELVSFVRTGHTSRPDTLMVAIGGLGHFVLIIGCMVAFLSMSPSRKQWAKFLGGGFIALAYLVLIIILAAPH